MQRPAAEWLLNDREGRRVKDGGWEGWVGDSCKDESGGYRKSIVEGAHHFSLMQREIDGGKVEEVGKWLERCF